MDSLLSSSNKEIIKVIDDISADRNMPKEIITSALEDAIRDSLAMKYGSDIEISVKIDRQNGKVSVCKVLNVVDDSNLNNVFREITFTEASKIGDYSIGDTIKEPIPYLNIGRKFTTSVQKHMNASMRVAEKKIEYDEFSKKIGALVSGTIKEKISGGGYIVDIGNRAEGIIKKEDLVSYTERFRIGDSLSAIIKNVVQNKDIQIILSRSSEEFLQALFNETIPEIQEGVVEIVKIARINGFKSKVVVRSNDESVDPIAICIGAGGSRIKKILNELSGEKIDMVRYDFDKNTFIKNTLYPIIPIKMESKNNILKIVLPDDKISLAIGRGGKNLRLLSEIIGSRISVLSEQEELDGNKDHLNKKVTDIMSHLDIDEIIAQILVSEGYFNINDIANATIEDLSSIEQFDNDISEELINRAKDSLDKKEKEFDSIVKKNKISDELISLFENKFDILTLIENDIKSIEDLALLSDWELLELFENNPNYNESNTNEIISVVKKLVFADK